jgi:DNA-binding protein YbaB
VNDSLPVIGEGLDLRLWRRRLLILRERVAGGTVTVESDDGLIVATVGGLGRLLDLRLDPRVYRDSDARRLADRITGVLREATRQARKRIGADITELMSEGGRTRG